MRKEFVVVGIDSAPDGSPQVLVSLADPAEVQDRGRGTGYPQVGGNFGSMDDMMKNINRIIAGQMMGRFTTTLKLSIKEYQDSGIRIGDKVYIDITKPAQET